MLIFSNSYKGGDPYLGAIDHRDISRVDTTSDGRGYFVTRTNYSVYTNETPAELITCWAVLRKGDLDVQATRAADQLMKRVDENPQVPDKDINADAPKEPKEPKAKPPKSRPGVNRG